ncbi:MAG: DUF2293 domain-containing protein [Rhodobacteraceae bacterium]|nr:DUF2293 domain-containing protein [Paracoccaceae bacterium]
MCAPGVPFADALKIIEIASAGHLRHLPASIAIQQALTSYVRHEMTDYDALLDEGYDRDAARHFVMGDMEDILNDWSSDHAENETKKSDKLRSV